VIVAGASALIEVVDQPFEQVILVNNGLHVLRIDDCTLDGEMVRPGPFPRPIDVSATLSCPVYENRDASYVGCLVVKREKQNDRRIDILASLKPGRTIQQCTGEPT
jgi:hypothetical protein